MRGPVSGPADTEVTARRWDYSLERDTISAETGSLQMALHAACRVCAHAHTQHAQARTRTCYKNEETQQLESAAVRRSEAGPDDAAGRTVSPGDLRSPASITHSCARLRDKPKYCLYGHWQTKGTEAEGDEGTCQRSRNYVVCSRDGLRTKPAVGRPLHPELRHPPPAVGHTQDACPVAADQSQPKTQEPSDNPDLYFANGPGMWAGF